LKRSDNFGDLAADGRILLMWILKKIECEDVDLIQLTQG
jgi:hypothetical protein